MKRLISTFAFFVIFATLSFGQTDSEYAKTLKKMFEVSGSEESYKMAINQMISIYKQQFNNVDQSIWVEFEQEFQQTSLNDLVEMLVPVYEKYMTIEDLNALIAFYQTPAGEKYAKNTPMIMQESMQVGQQWGLKIGQKVIEKIEMKNKQ